MATGYTYPIKDGEHNSVRKFILDCSRAMGAAIMQRDDDPSVPIKEMEVSDYYGKEIDKVKARLAEMRERTLEEWAVMERENREENLQYRKTYLIEKAQTRARYDEMLNKVKEWTPPTTEHENLKNFMIEQIESSISHDCSDSYTPPVPDPRDPAEYAAKEISAWAERLAWYEEKWEEEKARVASQNKWVRELYESVEGLA